MPFSPVVIAAASPVDLSALRSQLDKAGTNLPLHLIADGGELIGFLQLSLAPGAGRTSMRPCLLFLDLELPGAQGFETVQWIRQQRPLKDLPIVLFAASIEPRDVKRAAALGVTRIVTHHPTPRAIAEIIVATSRMN
jgi:CheY-like chemotaxis protein